MSDYDRENGESQPPKPRPRSARGGGATYASRSKQGAPGSGNQSPQERPYKLYRSAPRGLTARLRGETDAELEARADQLSRKQPPRAPRSGGSGGSGGAGGGRGGGSGGPGAGGGRGGGGRGDGGGYGGPDGPDFGLRPRRRFRIPGFRSTRPPFHPLRILKWVVTFCIFWVVLSAVLFFISAESQSGNLPGGSTTENALASAGPMLFTPNNILVVGLDNRPTSGYSSQEGGLSSADQSETSARTDTLMIWRVGGGVSRRLSIPRDTVVDLGGNCGEEKINAAWVCGGPKETIQAVETLTGVKINHMIVVDLGNFVKFIDDIGGVTVNTPRICSEISGGAANGGYTLNLRPGGHHLTGVQAVTLARTRENSCNPSYNDIEREQMQQEIMNGIKNQLFSIHAFIHLPWASWDAPGAIQTDMGGLTLAQLFVSAEIGGNSKPQTLKESGGVDGSLGDVLYPSRDDVQRKVEQLLHGD